MNYEDNKIFKDIVEKMTKNLYYSYCDLLERRKDHLDVNIVRKINLPMSSYCEDEVAIASQKILGNEYDFLIDVNLSFNGKKKYRPDIVIFKRNNGVNKIVGIIEVKAQMGYCDTPDLKPSTYMKKIDRLRKSKKKKILFNNKDIDSMTPKQEIIDKSNLIDIENDGKLLDFYQKFMKDNEKLSKKNNFIEYEIADNLNVFVVNVLCSNHMNKVKEAIYRFDHEISDNVHFYCLFGIDSDNPNKLWYNNLEYDKLFGGDKDFGDEVDKRVSKKKYLITKKTKEKHGFEQFYKDLKSIIS